MRTSLYRERNYALGGKMLALRTTLGWTQAGLAKHLGVSRRAVGEWEAGGSYPKAEHLKELIALAVKNQVWPSGHEAEEIRALWKAARQKVLLEERWLSALLDHPRSSHPHLVSAPIEETMPNALVEPLPASGGPRVDWGDALAVPLFYGREEELAHLTQWVVQERCRVVSVLGMGGIGKSALAVKLMYQSACNFEVIIFRSLRNVPSCEAILDDCLQVLAPQSLSVRPTTLEQRLSLLLPLLRTQRVLVVLDNAECLLIEQDVRGHFRAGFEGYGQLLRRVAEAAHESCLLLTSREKLVALRPLEGRHSPVRSLRLAGLSVAACRQLFEEKGLVGTLSDQDRLIELYGGNPLALKVVTTAIMDLFGGEIGLFLGLGTVSFGGICELLDEHFAHLSVRERRVLCWLAIVREPVTIDELLSLLATPEPRIEVLEALDASYRHSLIERGKRVGSFTLQSVVLEYVTAFLVAQGSREIQEQRLDLLLQHGLSQAAAREYVRETQEQLLLSPILADLHHAYLARARGATSGSASAEEQLLSLLNQLRGESAEAVGYGSANLIALLRLQRGNLNGLDLSHLCIRGAYLQNIEMHDTSLAGALIRDSVFTQAVSATWAVTMSRDGEWWAMGSVHGKVRVWREGGRTLHLIWQAHTTIVATLAFSPDGRTLASGSTDNTVKLWNVDNGTLLWTGWQNSPLCLAFTLDGTLLASGGYDDTVRIWDPQSGRNLHTLKHSSHVHAVAFSPDGGLLASGCSDGPIRLWKRQQGSPATYVPILSVQQQSDWVTSLAFTADGRTLASTSMGDQTVKVWEVASLRLLHALPEHAGQSWCVAWSPDGRTLAYSSADKAIWLWDIEQGKCRVVLHGHTAEVYGLAFTSSGERLLSGGADGTLRVWDVESYQCTRVVQGYGVCLWDLDWSPDGMHLVTGGTDGLVTIWDLSDGSPRVLHGHTWIIPGVRWSPGGKFLASCGYDMALLLWDPNALSSVQRLQDAEAGFLCMAWSPNGCLLACGTYQRGIQVWDVAARSLLRWVGQTLPIGFHSVAWSPNNAQLVSGGEDGCVYLWESADGTGQVQDTAPAASLQGPTKLSGHHGWVTSVAWSPDGRLLASGSGNSRRGELFLWDVRSRERLQTFAEHPDRVYALAWSPGGDQLISGGCDGLLRWWDVQSGECVSTQETQQGTIRSLKVSPDGKSLASCGEDGGVKIWDVESGEHRWTLRRDRPYERLNVAGIRGLTRGEISSLQALGAVGDAAL